MHCLRGLDICIHMRPATLRLLLGPLPWLRSGNTMQVALFKQAAKDKKVCQSHITNLNRNGASSGWEMCFAPSIFPLPLGAGAP